MSVTVGSVSRISPIAEIAISVVRNDPGESAVRRRDGRMGTSLRETAVSLRRS
ncbi:MAG TPA: hypothetical protein VNZ58_11250 [Thermomicrobiales bacterium]|nr:hypothetical protein [Thermomicrobiales bacterium]